MKILVSRTVTHENNLWPQGIDVIDELDYVESRFRRFPPKARGLAQRWYEFQFGLHILGRAHNYDGFALGRYGIWFPILLRLFRLKKIVVMTDTEWPGLTQGRVNRAAALASVKVCCFTRTEIDRYSSHYKIPRDKFVFVPFSVEVCDLREPTDQGYIFAGGKQNRDWPTFLEAVKGLPYPVRVFTTKKLASVPSNVSVNLVGREEYYSHMSAASCVVIPVGRESTRITGIRSWTNAMGMGKVVVVTEPLGAPDYMDQGISGFYVNHGDVDALRTSIVRVMEDQQLRERVGHAARQRALQDFSPEVFHRRIVDLLEGKEGPEAPAATPPSTTDAFR
jgi:glycosyltransferase involved in cell wall biosynthesis